MSAFRDVVADFQAVLATAEFACDAGREVVRQSEKDLRAKRLKKGPPGITGQCGFQRADALRGYDGNALRLAREAEELLITERLILSDGCEVLVFVAQEEAPAGSAGPGVPPYKGCG